MKSPVKAWKKLSDDHRDYVYIYVTVLLWALAYYFFTPTVTQLLIVDRFVLTLWLGVTIFSSVVAVSGLLTGNNLLMERLGVTVLSITPLIYAALQVSLIFYLAIFSTEGVDSWQTRIYLVFLGIWGFIFLNKRRRQLSRRVHEIKLLQKEEG